MNKKPIIFIVVITFIVCFIFYFIYQNNEREEIAFLIKKIRSEAPEVRDQGVSEISKYHDIAIAPLMVLLMENKNADVRKSAIEALGNIKSEAAATALINYYQKTHGENNFWNVTEALLSIGKPATESMFKSFDNSDESSKVLILNTFNVMSGTYRDKNMLNNMKQLYLRAFLNDNSFQVRKFALIFLANIGYDDEEIQTVLSGALNDRDVQIRQLAETVVKGK